MKRFSSIGGELTAFCVTIILLSMVFQIVFNLFFARGLAIYQKEQEIESLYNLICENYSDDTLTIYSLVYQAESEGNISIHILDGDDVIYTSAPYDQVGKAPMMIGELNSINHNRQPQSAPPTVETDLTMVRLEESFYYGDEIRTVLILSSVVAIESSVELFTLSSVIVSFFVLLIAILGVLLFSRRFTKPIEDIERVAKNVANYQFDQKANDSVRPQELRSLASSINTMSANLHSFIDQLETDNASLSSKVEYQEQLEQMRRQFIANISHEMKTPLSMLMMYSESLKSDIAGIDKDFYYDTIIQEATGLNTMVGQLLDISSIENGLIQLVPTPMDFSAFAEEVMEKMTPLLASYQVNCNITAGLHIEGDGKYLSQAITNYLNNAIAHTQEGNSITLTLIQDGNCALLSVTNQGAPIPEEDLPYIWDSFYRSDKSRTSQNQKRVGLGLYIVKTCIQAHDGSVSVSNGDGTVTFTLALPLI